MDLMVSGFVRHKAMPNREYGRWLRRELTHRGAPYVKMGQFMFSRPEFIGQDASAELVDMCCTREDDGALPPDVETRLAKLGAINLRPIASASVARVYAGRHACDGSAVVAKVIKPGVRGEIAAFRGALQTLRHVSWQQDVRSWLSDYDHWLCDEVDFEKEAGNMKTMAQLRTATVPRLIAFDADAIVMSHEPCSPVDDDPTAACTRAAVCTRAAQLLFTCFVEQVLALGVYHADLHPGNVCATSDGITLYDFSSVHPFPPSILDAAPSIMLALLRGDSGQMAYLMAYNGIIVGDMSECQRLCSVLLAYLREPTQLSQFMHTVVAQKIKARPSPEFASFMRAFALMEGTCRKMDADFNTLRALQYAFAAVAHDSRFHARELARLVRSF